MRLRGARRCRFSASLPTLCASTSFCWPSCSRPSAGGLPTRTSTSRSRSRRQRCRGCGQACPTSRTASWPRTGLVGTPLSRFARLRILRYGAASDPDRVLPTQVRIAHCHARVLLLWSSCVVVANMYCLTCTTPHAVSHSVSHASCLYSHVYGTRFRKPHRVQGGYGKGNAARY